MDHLFEYISETCIQHVFTANLKVFPLHSNTVTVLVESGTHEYDQAR